VDASFGKVDIKDGVIPLGAEAKKAMKLGVNASGIDLGKTGKRASLPEVISDERYDPFDAWLISGFRRTRGVDQEAVVARELFVAPVERRVIEVGLKHARLEIIGHEARWDTAEELEAGDVAFQPCLLIHAADSMAEGMATAREHEGEDVDGLPPTR